MKPIKEYVCRYCKGAGEEVIEPGGDGYLPKYDDCESCNGTGIEIYDKELVYEEF